METSPLQGPRCICKSHQGHKDGAPHAATWKLHTHIWPHASGKENWVPPGTRRLGLRSLSQATS